MEEGESTKKSQHRDQRFRLLSCRKKKGKKYEHESERATVGSDVLSQALQDSADEPQSTHLGRTREEKAGARKKPIGLSRRSLWSRVSSRAVAPVSKGLLKPSKKLALPRDAVLCCEDPVILLREEEQFAP